MIFYTSSGLQLYYEVSGNGSPVILLHGNGESGRTFNEHAKFLSVKHRVYVIDSRCHGKSERAAQISYALMAQDLKEFIVGVKITNPAVFGSSDGGIVALIAAKDYGGLLGPIIVAGANLYPDGLKRSALFGMKFLYFLTRNKRLLMSIKEPDILPEELFNVKNRTLVLAGEFDMVKTEHTKLIAASLPNSSLIIIKGENHFSYVGKPVVLCKIIEDFLNNN